MIDADDVCLWVVRVNKRKEIESKQRYWDKYIDMIEGVKMGNECVGLRQWVLAKKEGVQSVTQRKRVRERERVREQLLASSQLGQGSTKTTVLG